MSYTIGFQVFGDISHRVTLHSLQAKSTGFFSPFLNALFSESFTFWFSSSNTSCFLHVPHPIKMWEQRGPQLFPRLTLATLALFSELTYMNLWSVHN